MNQLFQYFDRNLQLQISISPPTMLITFGQTLNEYYVKQLNYCKMFTFGFCLVFPIS